jgi:excisionase family DNA binding protein
MSAYEAREWESVASAAEYARVSAKTIRRRIADGSLPARRVGPKLIRIDPRDLDRLFRPVAAEIVRAARKQAKAAAS